ncbi:alpha-1,4-glucan--maltose-1-phosphate maltosyltransferase [Streptomyces albogriseolus]|uniref:Starch synthase (Maltosyl-transferring) n=1 Tax=Streptomyces albogriseolus TaxID=1887 RepID=A0ACC6UT68_STRAO|nr:alpha-1,4-glucan--maltose-1-phosphate maltosyltransferase [Streptomyces viridodiastaticus]MCX4622482.1 alpha-1,4-glucan--maltose-1-phosphate maltosyltransferase [Streptomyces viridodiastaticus]
MPAKHHSSSPSPSGAKASSRPDTAPPRGRPSRTEPAAPSVPGTPASPAPPETSVGRIPVLDVRPLVRQGRRPAKAVVGETFEVTATVFREGHDAVAANVVLKDPEGRPGPFTPMRELAPGTDRWGATVTPAGTGLWTYAVEAWGDPVTTWRHHAQIKVPAGIDTEVMLEEGARLLERAAEQVPGDDDREVLRAAVDALRDTERPAAARLAAALTPEVDAVLARHPLRELVTSSEPLPLLVERERALFGSWYEFFPRSEGTPEQPHGTFDTAARRLPAIAAMGFDVVYLPPIHPIGTTFRKGPNNTLDAGPDDVGVPWAIGSPEGGHDAVHPRLGTLEDFTRFVARARDLGMEVALDFALQCSPDHPWVHKHPEWFHHRPDGSIAYAENPPKKYQDIYPVAFDADMDGLVAETCRILRHWMDAGVRIFRVDNPHTKPVVFWERVIGEINRTDPDVIFLAEAFTRPAMMHTLAQIGFQQSYTYFTWRTTKQELTEYLTELSGEAASYMRPNFFANTPDILHAYLQHGGRPAFEVRAVLAATLSPTWGIYSGYELCENTPLREGGEEYLDSEKYQLKPRDWEAAEREGRTIAPLLTRLNTVRRENPALRQLRDLHFHQADKEEVIAYSKRRDGNTVLVVANLDTRHTQEATVSLDMPQLGLDWHESVPVRDELTGETYQWGSANYVRLGPGGAHVLVVGGRSGDGPSGTHSTVLRPSTPQIGGSSAT